MLTQTRFSIAYVRPESHQLFFLFVGVWESLTIHALDFLRATAVGDRNIVIMKDPYHGHCYQRGISDEYDSLDGIARWQQEQLASQFPHVKEVFCAGASAGGSPAIYTGYKLRARAAWSLGGRIVKPDMVVERDRVVKDLYQKVIGRTVPGGLTPSEHSRLVEVFSTPEVRRLRWDLSGNPETMVPQERIDSLVGLLRQNSTPTHFHFYYANPNVMDREFAEAFRGCPNVNIHTFEPPPYDWSRDVTFRDPDHNIVQMLHEMGQLGKLFADYI